MTQKSSAARRPVGYAIAAGAAGAALALGALWAAGEMTSPAKAQEPPSAGTAGFTLSVGQLRINQRISQAAVRRSNESLNLLDPLRGTGLKGWRTEDLRDGSITNPKLADGAVTGPKVAPASVGGAHLTAELANRLPMWAVVAANGDPRYASEGVTSTRINNGNYRVKFPRDVRQCASTATQNVVNPVINMGFIGVQVDVTNPDTLYVRTTSQPNPNAIPPANASFADRAFTVQVTC